MLRTSDQYRAALQDGREVYYRGRRIPDVLAEPELRVAVDHAAIDFDLAHDPSNHELMVAKDPETGEDDSAYYRIPRTPTICWLDPSSSKRSRPPAARWSR